jgi:hypothetical protein
MPEPWFLVEFPGLMGVWGTLNPPREPSEGLPYLDAFLHPVHLGPLTAPCASKFVLRGFLAASPPLLSAFAPYLNTTRTSLPHTRFHIDIHVHFKH